MQATEQDVHLRQDSGRSSNSPARWTTVGLVALAVFFTALDQTVVATVLPHVMVDLRIPVSELDQASWIITGYLVGYTVVIPLAARLADAHGHAVLFRLSLVLFGVASVAVALSPDLPWLVGSRVVQAAGGGATIPIGLALATQAMPRHRRAIAVGYSGRRRRDGRGARPAVRRRHHRGLGLAMALLAGRAAGPAHPDPAPEPAEDVEPGRKGGLCGRAVDGGGSDTYGGGALAARPLRRLFGCAVRVGCSSGRCARRACMVREADSATAVVGRTSSGPGRSWRPCRPSCSWARR